MNKKNIILMIIITVLGIIYLNSQSYIYWQASFGIRYAKVHLMNFWSIVFLWITVIMCVIKRNSARYYTKYVIQGSLLGIVITLIMIFVFRVDKSNYFSSFIMYSYIDKGTVLYTIIIILYMVACDALSTIIMKKINCICNKRKKTDTDDINDDINKDKAQH